MTLSTACEVATPYSPTDCKRTANPGLQAYWVMRSCVGLAVVAAALLGACAGPEPQPPVPAAPVAAAAVVVPPLPKAPLVARFECAGALLHPPIAGVGESAISFWLGLRQDGSLVGRADHAGLPLDLGPGPLSGHMTLDYDGDGRLIGGTALVDWPHSRNGRAVELALARETFIRSGPQVNGVGTIIRRASKHTYMTGLLTLDPDAHPALAGMSRAIVLSATCLPSNLGSMPVPIVR
jgi:hypothetical protein